MLPSIPFLRRQLYAVIDDKGAQGHMTQGLKDRLEALPDSYDQLQAFALELRDLPIQPDWPYSEPNDLESIWAECDPARPQDPIAEIDLEDCSRRVEAAFLGSVCGCILGKPLEVRPDLYEIRDATQAIGDWPLNDYISEKMLDQLGRLHASYRECVRERIQYVAADDDINYTILGMLLIEEFGLALTPRNVMETWLLQLPPRWTFGPERGMLVKAAMHSTAFGDDYDEGWLAEWVSVINPYDEKCGALIRADALGYACPGRPALAAELAWRDASWTHRRTGIYGEMFVAAALAAAPTTSRPLDMFRIALQFVPQRSRFHAIACDSLQQVELADDWLDGYERIHGKYHQYGHCLILQEIGTMMNTLRFAESVGDGICKQVAQGNDTDSFGATAGSLLGAYFGPGHLEPRWLAPFNDKIHAALGAFHEQSLSALAKRMGRLPFLIAEQLKAR